MLLIDYLMLMVGGEIQLRVRWNPDDLVIWDNRAVYHVREETLSPPFTTSIGRDSRLTNAILCSVQLLTTLISGQAIVSVAVARNLSWTLVHHHVDMPLDSRK